MNKNQNAIHIAPIMRFMVELTTWIWLMLLGIETFGFSIVNSQGRGILDSWVFLVLLLISLLFLSQLNFPGDKKPYGKMVTGWQRISVEIFSAILGIFAAWILFGLLGGIFQAVMSIFSFFLDRERWKWFLGYRETPPDFVLNLGHFLPS